MTTYHPDTQVQDPGMLRWIDCAVLRRGTLRIGDPVEVPG
jgi:hypothetical protein